MIGRSFWIRMVCSAHPRGDQWEEFGDFLSRANSPEHSQACLLGGTLSCWGSHQGFLPLIPEPGLIYSDHLDHEPSSPADQEELQELFHCCDLLGSNAKKVTSTIYSSLWANWKTSHIILPRLPSVAAHFPNSRVNFFGLDVAAL